MGERPRGRLGGRDRDRPPARRASSGSRWRCAPRPGCRGIPAAARRSPIGGAEFGHAGELHPKVCKAYGVPPRTAALEIDLDFLIRHAVDVVPGPQFSTYPLAKEDVALVVDADVTVAAVEESLRAGAGELLESVRLFDVFTGEQIGAGKKSLAFALRFRAPDRTLTEEETSAARDAAVAVAAERTGAVQRV